MNADLMFSELDSLAGDVELAKLGKLAAEVGQWAGLHRARRECMAAVARTKRRATKSGRAAVLDERPLRKGEFGYNMQQNRLEVEFLRQRSEGMSGRPWRSKGTAYETK